MVPLGQGLAPHMPRAGHMICPLLNIPYCAFTRSCWDFGEFGRIVCAMRVTPEASEAQDPLMVPLGQGLAPHMPRAGHITCPLGARESHQVSPLLPADNCRHFLSHFFACSGLRYGVRGL